MRPIPLPFLLFLFSLLHRPLHSTVVDTLLSFDGIAGEELATPIPILNAEEELVVGMSTNKPTLPVQTCCSQTTPGQFVGELAAESHPTCPNLVLTHNFQLGKS